MNAKPLLIIGLTLLLTACGTLTGIPSHGGGKRFAVEQELVTASARAAAKNIWICIIYKAGALLYTFPPWAIKAQAQ